MLVRPHPELALTLKIRKLALGDCRTWATWKGDGLGIVAARGSLVEWETNAIYPVWQRR